MATNILRRFIHKKGLSQRTGPTNSGKPNFCTLSQCTGPKILARQNIFGPCPVHRSQNYNCLSTDRNTSYKHHHV